MSKQLTRARFARTAAVSLEDRDRVVETQHKIRTAYGIMGETWEGRKQLTNLPTSVFLKTVQAFNASKRGLIVEEFYSRNVEPLRFTQTNEKHRGDLTDGKGKRHEVKSSGVSPHGHVQFREIRLEDEVDYFHFLIRHEDSIEAFEIPRNKLDQVGLVEERNTPAHRLQFRYGGGKMAKLASLSTRHELNDTNTGLRWDSLRFLDEADVLIEDLDHLVETKQAAAQAVSGHGKAAHLTKDELIALQPLVSSSKFGLLVQDWLCDHLEIARSQLARNADGVGRDQRRIEIKHATVDSGGKFQITGINPLEFDDLYIALLNGEEMELFHLSRLSATRFVRRFGTVSNPERGIFKVSTGSKNGKALKFLRSRRTYNPNARVR